MKTKTATAQQQKKKKKKKKKQRPGAPGQVKAARARRTPNYGNGPTETASLRDGKIGTLTI